MMILDTWTRFVQQLDKDELYRLIAIAGGILLLSISIFLYRYYSILGQLEKRLKHVNQQRTEAGSILEQHERVVAQQHAVDTLLQEDTSFKIKNFFATTLQSLTMAHMLLKDTEISSQPLVDGYTEIELNAQLQGFNMYQLLTLLYTIEQNRRVYIKDIKITKANSLLNVALSIATFEAAEIPA